MLHTLSMPAIGTTTLPKLSAALRLAHAKLNPYEVHALYLGAVTSTNPRFGPTDRPQRSVPLCQRQEVQALLRKSRHDAVIAPRRRSQPEGWGMREIAHRRRWEGRGRQHHSTLGELSVVGRRNVVERAMVFARHSQPTIWPSLKLGACNSSLPHPYKARRRA